MLSPLCSQRCLAGCLLETCKRLSLIKKNCLSESNQRGRAVPWDENSEVIFVTAWEGIAVRNLVRKELSLRLISSSVRLLVGTPCVKAAVGMFKEIKDRPEKTNKTKQPILTVTPKQQLQLKIKGFYLNLILLVIRKIFFLPGLWVWLCKCVCVSVCPSTDNLAYHSSHQPNIFCENAWPYAQGDLVVVMVIICGCQSQMIDNSFSNKRNIRPLARLRKNSYLVFYFYMLAFVFAQKLSLFEKSDLEPDIFQINSIPEM